MWPGMVLVTLALLTDTGPEPTVSVVRAPAGPSLHILQRRRIFFVLVVADVTLSFQSP